MCVCVCVCVCGRGWREGRAITRYGILVEGADQCARGGGLIQHPRNLVNHRLAQGYCGTVNAAMDRYEARLQAKLTAAAAAAAAAVAASRAGGSQGGSRGSAGGSGGGSGAASSGGGARRVTVPAAAAAPSSAADVVSPEAEEAEAVEAPGMKAVVESFDEHVEELTTELRRMYEQLMRREAGGSGGEDGGEGMQREVSLKD